MADDLNLSQKYLDAINEAISIHTTNAVQGLAFNKTETATIVGEQDSNGFYPVYNGSVRYMAKSEKTDYKKGTTVYVTIPNNDTSQEKYIVGMLRDKDGKGLKYISPLQKYSPDHKLGNFLEKDVWKIPKSDDFWTSTMLSIGATAQLDYNNMEGTGLVANYNLQKKSQGSEYVFLYQSKNLQDCTDINGKNYKYIGVSADFKTLLSAYHVIKGDYGIQIFIQYSYNQEGREAERVYQTLTYRLSTQDMIGAVYNFNTYYKQEALFQIDNDTESGTKIHRIGIVFYQDGNFTNSDGKINTQYEINNLKNILLKNLSIEFGDDLPAQEIDDLRIFTTNGQYYDSAQLNEKLNEKHIQLKWKHLDYDNKDDEDNPGTLVEITSPTSMLSSDSDVPLYPRITWYKDSLHTLADFRAEEAEAVNDNDRLYELLEKYKNSIVDRDRWLEVWQDEFTRISEEETLDTITQKKYEKAYTELRDSFYEALGQHYEDSSQLISRDEMYDLINELNLKSSEDYFYNPETEMYYLTPTGEKVLDRKITRNAKSFLSEAASSEDGRDHWIPIAKNTLSVDFIPEEELKRNSFAIKCIVEYGPVDGNGELIRESDHYIKLVSNELTFINLTAVPDPNTQDAAIGVKLYYDNEDSNGNYPLYDGQTGRILNNSDYIKERILKMDFVSKYSGKSYLNGNETIIWEVPKTNTMLNFLGYLTEESPDDITKRRLITDDSEGQELAEKYLINYDPINFYYICLECYNSNGVPIYNELHYQIKEYYTQSATNNTITCHLIKNQQIYSGYTTMYFSHKGTNGTDYTFSLGLGELVDDNWNIVGPADSALTIGEVNWRRITFDLFDADCKQINLTNEQKNDIIEPWVRHNQIGYYTSNLGNSLTFKTKEENGLLTEVAVKTIGDVITDELRYIVLQASLRSDATSTYNNKICKLDNILFTQFLQIPIKIDSKYYLNGSGIIYYNDDGALMQGSNDPIYTLSNCDNEQNLRIIANGEYITTASDNSQYYPSFTKEWKLHSVVWYIRNIAYESDYSDRAAKIAIDCYDGENLVYTVPLLMIQNKYQIPAINRWNGKLLIDSENNQIMSAMISAGHKEADGRLTGIMMGDVVKQGSTTPESGIFGYSTGAQSFGLKTDGTAFIGKSGTGRIRFDGSSGEILSANYSVTNNTNRSGTKIDLDDGSIDMWGRGVVYKYDTNQNKFVYDSGTEYDTTNIHLGVKGEYSDPYFKIEVPKYRTTNNNGTITATPTSSRQSLIQIDKNNFYLQTADYDTTAQTGLKLDLKHGTFDSQGVFRMTAKAGSYIRFGDNLILRSGANATSTIGGWTIGTSSLYTNGFSISSSGSRGASISTQNWGISADGYAWFKNIQAGDATTWNGGLTGFGYADGRAWFNGDIYANNGYFTGTVSAATITGSEISGGTVTAESLTLGGTPVTFSTVNFLVDKIECTASKESIKDVVRNLSLLDITIHESPSSTESANANVSSGGGYYEGGIWHPGSGVSGGDHSHSIKQVPTRVLNFGTWTKANFEIITALNISYYTKTVTVLNAGTTNTQAVPALSFTANANAGSSSSGCFDPDTEILMADYSMKKIKDIIVGDFILAYNKDTDTYKSKKVLKKMPHYNTLKMIWVYLENGTKIHMTPDHPILTMNGWQSFDPEQTLKEHHIIVNRLFVGQYIFTTNGFSRIKSISNIEYPENYTSYNITVDKLHNYIANSIIVHNAQEKPA